MKDVQDGLVLKNMPYLVRGEICGIFETNDLTKAQKKKYIKSKNEIDNRLKNGRPNYKYARSDIMEKIIKTVETLKNVNRTEKENQRDNFT